MKKIYYIGFACLAAIAFSACSDDDPSTDNPGTDVDPNAHLLGITTNVQIKASAVTDFKEGDKMNLFVKTTERTNGTDKVAGVSATRTASGWQISPDVPLSKGDVCYVYAVSPYSADNTDASAIPVDIADQADVMYSGATACSYQTHNITLTMKHALSLMTFNIAGSGYSGAGVINSLSVNGEIVYTKGTMDAGTGTIIGRSQEQVTVPYSLKISDKEKPSMWVIPFNNKGKEDGATLTAVIDGKTYTVTVPEVEMRTGYQYSFQLALSNYGLSFIPGGLQTLSLNGEGSEVEIPGSHGVVTFGVNTQTWNMPTFEGDGVFGNAKWGDNTSSYADGAPVATGGRTDISVETWNSTGFELENVVGIETIDISQY